MLPSEPDEYKSVVPFERGDWEGGQKNTKNGAVQ